MIKAVIFDLGGVLFTDGTKKFIQYLKDAYSLNEDAVKEALDGQIGTAYREAKISRDEFWNKVKEKLKIKENINYLEDKWIDGYEVITGTKLLLFELKKKYKIYFLSDNVKERVDRLNDKFHFISWFDGGIFSHEVGFRKPNPQIYKMIMAKAKVGPGEGVYIDDKPALLEPAKALGLVAFVFETPEKLRKELHTIGVL